MIAIELGHALVLYSSLLALLIAGIWVYTEFSVMRPQRSLGKQFLWRCDICGLSYLDEIAETLSRCPRCKSFNELEGTPEKVVPQRHEVAGADERRNTSRRKRHHQKRRGPRRRR